MKYENGKIYSIRSPNTDKIYIGSTCQPLSKRFHQHKMGWSLKKRRTSAWIILDAQDAYIELVEDFPCKSREELLRRKGELIRENKTFAVNEIVAGRTKKEYLEDNMEHMKAMWKKYRDEHKEQYRERYKEREKEYREKNAEHLRQNTREWYQKNKERVKERHGQRFKCDCGSNIALGNKAQHYRAIKHQEWIQSKQ